MRNVFLAVLASLIYPTLVRRASRAPGLSPLPWPGPAGEVNVAVVDLDGALVDVVQCKTPRDLMRVMAANDPGAPSLTTVARTLRRALRPA